MAFPPSDHFNGKRFFYPGGSPVRGWRDLLRWKMARQAVPWPRRIEGDVRQAPRPSSGEIAVSWIGHASFLIQTPEGNFLTDPVYSERIGPVSGFGPARAMAPGVAFDSLPRIDAVLLSHDHYDHCDLPTLRRLAGDRAPALISPLGYRRLAAAAGLGAPIELDWWQGRRLACGAEVRLVPARHWCRRSLGGTNMRLWGGFVLEAAGRRIYFAGDTGYDSALFPEISRRCGPLDLALLPIGAYAPRWFMAAVHMDPAEAVRAHRDLGARRSLPMHWGTFQLTDEGRDDPRRALEEARAAAGLAPEAFPILSAGGSVVL